MIGHFLHRVLGISRETIDKLGEIAPIIIFVVIWIVGIIAKAVAETNKARKGGQKPGQKKRPADFDEMINIVKQRYTAVREKTKKAEEQAEATLRAPARPSEPRKVSPRPKRPRQKSKEYPTAQQVLKPFNMPPSVALKEEVKVSPTRPTAQQRGEHPVRADTAPSRSYLAGLVSQYKDPRDLRKAILHYEILGTPVALRD